MIKIQRKLQKRGAAKGDKEFKLKTIAVFKKAHLPAFA